VCEYNLLTYCNVLEGGRLSDELAYTLKWLGEGSGTTYELIIQSPRRAVGPWVDGPTRSSSNVLTVKSMLQHLEAVRAVTKLSVELFDVYVPLSPYLTYIPVFYA